jgi:hypothetical protein
MTEQQNIIQGLDRISQFSEMHAEQDADLFPGISSIEIETILKGFTFKIPAELRQLYEHGHTSIFSGATPSRFRDIKDSISNYEEFWICNRIPQNELTELGRKYLSFYEDFLYGEENIENIDRYPPDGCDLPIAYGSGKETYFIKCYKTETNYLPVWVRHIGSPPVVYASSLTNLILTWAECYESGAYYSVFDKENNFYHLQEDWSKIQSIFEKYNPAQMDVYRSCYGWK